MPYTQIYHVSQYADDAAAGGKLGPLREWWKILTELDPAFGYLPNARKSWLIVKEGNLDAAKLQFSDIMSTLPQKGRGIWVLL